MYDSRIGNFALGTLTGVLLFFGFIISYVFTNILDTLPYLGIGLTILFVGIPTLYTILMAVNIFRENGILNVFVYSIGVLLMQIIVSIVTVSLY